MHVRRHLGWFTFLTSVTICTSTTTNPSTLQYLPSDRHTHMLTIVGQTHNSATRGEWQKTKVLQRTGNAEQRNGRSQGRRKCFVLYVTHCDARQIPFSGVQNWIFGFLAHDGRANWKMANSLSFECTTCHLALSSMKLQQNKCHFLLSNWSVMCASTHSSWSSPAAITLKAKRSWKFTTWKQLRIRNRKKKVCWYELCIWSIPYVRWQLMIRKLSTQLLMAFWFWNSFPNHTEMLHVNCHKDIAKKKSEINEMKKCNVNWHGQLALVFFGIDFYRLQTS